MNKQATEEKNPRRLLLRLMYWSPWLIGSELAILYLSVAIMKGFHTCYSCVLHTFLEPDTLQGLSLHGMKW